MTNPIAHMPAPKTWGRRQVTLGLGTMAGLMAAAPASMAQNGLLQAARTLSEPEQGLTQMLTDAALRSAFRLGQNDGFLRDAAVHIPLPGRVATLQQQLRRLGMARALDDLEVKLNRGAEQSMRVAADVLTDTIRNISWVDALNIVRGGSTAGTDYLARVARPPLRTGFMPIVGSAFDSAGVASAIGRIDQRYGRTLRPYGDLGGADMPADASLRDRFVSYTTDAALRGLFHYMAAEEQSFRADPRRRTTDLLRRVFGQ